MKSTLVLFCAVALVIPGPASARAYASGHEDDEVVMIDPDEHEVVVADDAHDLVFVEGDDVVYVEDDYDVGEVIPVAYLDERHYIDDYRAYHVHAPPPGHRWMRSSASELLLVAVATGLVVKALSAR